MIIKYKKLNYNLDLNFDFYFDKAANKFFIKGLYGVYYFFLPSYYFYLQYNNKLHFIFLKSFFFFSFLNHFFYFYNGLYSLLFFRLRLKGLGFRLKKVYKNIYRIFFGVNNYFYLYLPLNIIVRIRKRNILALSNNRVLLNDFYCQILFLRKFDYFLNSGGFLPKNKIVFLKEKKKIV
jgi:hypothetical protein